MCSFEEKWALRMISIDEDWPRWDAIEIDEELALAATFTLTFLFAEEEKEEEEVIEWSMLWPASYTCVQTLKCKHPNKFARVFSHSFTFKGKR